MNDKGYPSALKCFEKIWEEGFAEGKWQDDENLKIIYYDWFVTGWILRAVEDAEAELNEKIKQASPTWEGVDADKYVDEVRGNKIVLCYYGGVCRYPDGLCREECPKHKVNDK